MGGYQRFVCPVAHGGLGCPNVPTCPQRSVHLKPAMNPRYICEVSRASLQWEKEYDRRTTVERSHKRRKGDLGLERRYNRSRPVVYALWVLAAASST